MPRRRKRTPPEPLPEGLVELFWLPWCTSAYRKEYIDKRAAEERASGRWWDVQKRFVARERAQNGEMQSYYKLFLKVGRYETGPYVDRHEWAKRQGVTL